VRKRIREFIVRLEPRPSHYSRLKNDKKLYISANESKIRLYRRFLQTNPDLTPTENNRGAKYWLFCEIMDHEFNISIGYPRSDLCNECELFNTRITNARQENREEERHLLEEQQDRHWRGAEHFQDELRNAKQVDQISFSLCFDYQKNFVLPLTGIGKEYFSSHLNIYNLGFQNLATEHAVMVMYPQHYAHKSANEVASLLEYYCENFVPENVHYLNLFSDNAATNKNRFVFAMCQYLCLKRFHRITFTFPTPGHSFMPIDRSFALIEKLKKKEDRVVAPSTWTDLVKRSRPSSPFELLYLEKPFTDDMRNDETPTVRVKNFKNALNPHLRNRLSINTIKKITFTPDLHPQIATEYGEPCNQDLRLFIDTVSVNDILNSIDNAEFAYDEGTFLPVPQAAATSCHDILRHVIVPNNVTFFNNLHA